MHFRTYNFYESGENPALDKRSCLINETGDYSFPFSIFLYSSRINTTLFIWEN